MWHSTRNEMNTKWTFLLSFLYFCLNLHRKSYVHERKKSAMLPSKSKNVLTKEKLKFFWYKCLPAEAIMKLEMKNIFFYCTLFNVISLQLCIVDGGNETRIWIECNNKKINTQFLTTNDSASTCRKKSKIRDACHCMSLLFFFPLLEDPCIRQRVRVRVRVWEWGEDGVWGCEAGLPDLPGFSGFPAFFRSSVTFYFNYI
jgi:hypothetical protein